MQTHYSPLMRVTAASVLITFLMLILEPTAVAAQVLHKEYEQAAEHKAREQAAKLASTLKTVESTLIDWQQSLNSNTRQRRDQNIQDEVDVLKAQVLALDKHVQKDWKSTETHLRNKHLPDDILQRHMMAVASYQKNVTTLLNNLDEIKGAKNSSKLSTSIDKALTHLQPLQTQGFHPEFDPNQLPFSIPKGEIRAPFEEASALKSLFKAETTAQDRLRRPSKGPDASYLGATEDVQITPEIEALAQELEHKPVKIYNWVHDNIQFIPTNGSIQGSQLTLETKSGNATDTASLLIALLRASGIHSRYAYGTVRIPIDKVMNWVGGVTAPAAAIQILGQGGIPTAGLAQGGQIAFVKMEHVWVEAWVDYRPSRGARHRKGDSWIPMDASFKQYQFTEGMDIQDNVPFDAEGFAEQITNTAQINEEEGWVSGIDQSFMETSLQNYQTQIETYITQTNPDATVGEVLGTQTIIPSNRPTLAAGLPYTLIAKGNTFKDLPSNLRHHFKFSLYASEMDRILDEPALNLSQSLPAIAGKRLTLSFEPASDSDRQVIESYLPEVPDGQELDPNDLPTSLPGYLIKLKAQLKLDGEIVAESGSFTMGQELSSITGITRMTGGWHNAHNKPIVGEFYAFGIDLQGISAKQLETVKTRMEIVKTKLEAQQFEGLTKDGIIGDMLYAGALSYFAANDVNLKMLNKGKQALAYRQPSAGTFSTSLDPIYSFGVPRQVKMSGIRVDMDTVAQSLWSKNNDVQIANRIGKQVGMMSSAWEHRIPEMLFTNEENPGEAVSAVKALAIASAEGQRIYQVTSKNVNAVLPVLNISSEVKDEILASVAVGKVATVSQNNITVGSWTGVGYIIADPDTGAGAYRISGGANGADYLGFFAGYFAALTIVAFIVPGGVFVGMFFLWIALCFAALGNTWAYIDDEYDVLFFQALCGAYIALALFEIIGIVMMFHGFLAAAPFLFYALAIVLFAYTYTSFLGYTPCTPPGITLLWKIRRLSLESNQKPTYHIRERGAVCVPV
ncbi:MAG: hypothetical protein DRR16_13395 [Candidatus Parabeggiatoa sp. nov. 3]|nr:MAG: hypothetical protein DRR16_13395 [Gammaproteobacteria bacterium]